jgi:hypothetical protein
VRLAIVVGLLCAGCYRPVVATDVPCAGNGDCPSGQTCDHAAAVPTCVATLGDASTPPGDDAPLADTPRDGIPLDAPLDAPPMFTCPGNYLAIAGSTTRYRQVIMAQTWEAAAADCANDLAGHTHLAVLSSDNERLSINASFLGLAWIGLQDRTTNGTYRWITAENTNNYPPLAVPPWGNGQPTGGTDFDCVYLNGTFGLDDERCAVFFPYVCECDAFANDPSRYAEGNN